MRSPNLPAFSLTTEHMDAYDYDYGSDNDSDLEPTSRRRSNTMHSPPHYVKDVADFGPAPHQPSPKFLKVPTLQETSIEDDWYVEEPESSLNMLQKSVNNLVKEGISEGQRIAISSQLWRYASPSVQCDVLMILKHNTHVPNIKESCTWIVQILKKLQPNLMVEVRYHRLEQCYALYISADYASLLKGAELSHIKKTVKAQFGGGLRDFCFEEAQCYEGVEIRSTFLTGIERSLIVKQMLESVRASRGGLTLARPGLRVSIPEGMSIVSGLLACGVVDKLLPLHNSESLKHLQSEWVLDVFREQPIEQVKEYFGTEIAMYFAWLGHMTTALWFPAILGVLMFFVGGFKFSNHEDDGEQSTYQLFSDISFVLFAFFNCVWSTVYLESWKRKQAELAFRWGTYSVDSDPLLQDPRPQFKGDYDAPNPVSGRMEPFFPAWKHAVIRYGITYPVSALCVICLFFMLLCIFVAQDTANYYFADSTFFHWICYLPMIVYALIILISEKLYRHLALTLNNFENYRTDDEYEDFLISKIVIFQFVTAFGSLFFIAFYLRDMQRLQESLATLLITRQLTQNLLETAVPFFMEKFKLARLTYKMTKSMSDHTLRRHVEEVKKKTRRDSENSESFSLMSEAASSPPSSFSIGDGSSPPTVRRRHTHVEDLEPLRKEGTCKQEDQAQQSVRLPIPEFIPSADAELTQAELESLMSVYSRPLDDYLEMFIQFGYVLLFSPAFPLAAACALVNNLVEIRVDAFKLCNTVQRPFGRMVKDIGAWQKAMQVLGTLGVIVNCALIGQSGLVTRIWPEMTWTGQILLVVVLEHLILAAKAMIDMVVPDVPYWIRIETAKQEHFRREAFKRECRLLPPSTPQPEEPSDPMPGPSRASRAGDQVQVYPLPRYFKGSVKRRSVTPLVKQLTRRTTEQNIDKGGVESWANS